MEFNNKGLITAGDKITGDSLWLKSTWGLDGISGFYFSLDGIVFRPFGNSYQLAWGAYRGDHVAIYNYNDLDDKVYIEVDYFHYNYK